ncbi:MAG: hypothetical protein ACKVQQ_15075 [Burkholderiales bacterium]
MRRLPILFRLLLAGACLAGPAVASGQTTYRCGNVYQSHPCSLADNKGDSPAARRADQDTAADREQRERCARVGQTLAQNSARMDRATNSNEREALALRRAEIDREHNRSCN